MKRPAATEPMKEAADMAKVLAEELKRIQNRRVYLRFDRQLTTDPPEPTARENGQKDGGEGQKKTDGRAGQKKALEMGLTGLAFSGGGIRSATFCLGILQGLARLNLLQRFDYLSTVSGGGYIGAWLAAWIKREKHLANVELQLNPGRSEQARAERPPLELAQADREREVIPLPSQDSPYVKPGPIVDKEPEPIYHIRAYSNYLAPRPGISSPDTWALLAIYLRNFLINLLTILPATMILVILGRLVVCYYAQEALGIDWTLAFLTTLGVELLLALALGRIHWNTHQAGKS
jgi:hypothetical protein